jgi:hypothetical protein
MWIRRGHLYFGLFLFPWAVLYGVTAFLFNHPTVFSDQPTATFGPEVLTGTTLEVLPSAQAIAEQVVSRLNETQKPSVPYALTGPGTFGGRDFAFATVRAEGVTVNVLIDLKTGRGTVRSNPVPPRQETETAPFATGSAGPSGRRNGRGLAEPPGARGGTGLQLENPVHDQIKAAVPNILTHTGFPTGEVTVTSVPDVVFPVQASDRTWTAHYNPMTGAVSGTPVETAPTTELSWRRFLLRLHTAHGYPVETNARWFWALTVDVMAFTLCFWGLSGLVMWWQLKATRRLGFLLLVLSAVAATVLGFAMHAALTT